MPTMATTVWDMALAMLDMVDIPTEAMDADILARGLLMLSPLLMLMPTMDTTVLAMPDMLDIPTDLPMDTDTLARGLLMLSPLLMLMPTTDITVLDMVLAMPDMLDIPTDLPMVDTDTLARGLLMLSPLLMLMPTMDTTAMLLPTAMPDLMLLTPMDTDLTDICGNSTKNLKTKNQHSSSHITVKKFEVPI